MCCEVPSQHTLRPRDGNAEMHGGPEERERLETYLKKAEKENHDPRITSNRSHPSPSTMRNDIHRWRLQLTIPLASLYLSWDVYLSSNPSGYVVPHVKISFPLYCIKQVQLHCCFGILYCTVFTLLYTVAQKPFC